MTMGEKIRKARLEAGLSQRQLCEDVITRNMLSQIENGSARPSVDTLRHLASRLGKSIGYFLEEEGVVSPNQQVMESARLAADSGNWKEVLHALEGYREPDGIFCRERQLLETLAQLELAEDALEQGKTELARQLLKDDPLTGYHLRELERRRWLLLAKAAPEKAAKTVGKLPSLDEELILRAKAALETGNWKRCGQLLDAAQNRDSAQWQYLRGDAYLAAGRFTQAAVCLLKAEQTMPEGCWPKLEQCYRELGNYEKAYAYACKQKK